MDEHWLASLHELTLPQAIATAGALFHFVTASPEQLAAFSKWMEDAQEGQELDVVKTRAFLSRCHDLVAPGCPEPIEVY